MNFLELSLSCALIVFSFDTSGARLIGSLLTSPLTRVLQQKAIFHESNGLLVMEAESVPVVEPWKLESFYSDFTGSGYFRFDGNDARGGPPDGHLSYNFFIENPGEYTMVFRARKNNTDNATWGNDCYTALQDSHGTIQPLTKTFLQGTPNIWYFRALLELKDGSKLVPQYLFSKGRYELLVAGRSRDFSIDRIMFYQSSMHANLVVEDKTIPESQTILISTTEAPVTSPDHSLVPFPTYTPFIKDSGNITQVLINAGSDDENLSLVSGEYWSSYFEQEIVNVPTCFDPEFFKTHRSGKYFKYTIQGFEPYQQIEIILGFAENWLANCRLNRDRKIDVSVNGLSFVTNLNVFGEVGCYAALIKSKVFPADNLGVVTLEFSSSNPNQNPMVSLIGINPIRSDEWASGLPITMSSDSPSSSTSIITGLFLVAARGREEVMELRQDAEIVLDSLDTSELSIRADTIASVQWVRFSYDGLTQTEGAKPFTMDGKARDCCFNAVPYLATEGHKTVKIDAFEGSNLLESITLAFDVVGMAVVNFAEASVFVEDSLFPVAEVLIDCGSDTDNRHYVPGEVFRKYYSNATITGVPSIYDKSIFQTHRTGESPFNYTVTGFTSSQEAEITLGFAETYLPNCRNDKRIMSISVNGISFARSFDVYALAQCYRALLISKTFEADANGVFTIKFESTVQNPMVSLIAIDILEVEDPTVAPSIIPTMITSIPYPTLSPSKRTMLTSTPILDCVLAMSHGRTPLRRLVDGDKIDLAIVGNELSIFVITTDSVKWVRFEYDGHTHSEGRPPYAMNGKNASCCFNTVSYLSFEGTKTVKVDAFAFDGRRIQQFIISFDIVQNYNGGGTLNEAGLYENEDQSSDPVFDVWIDCGSVRDPTSFLADGNFRSFYSNETIQGVPTLFQESMFQTHRWSNALYHYNITGFFSGLFAEVTLGFAENWKPACKNGKRIMDITVNGVVFAENLDIYAEAGCFTAFLIKKVVKTDTTGSFIVEVSASVQNSLISVIALNIMHDIAMSSESPTITPIDSNMTSEIPTQSLVNDISGLFLVHSVNREEIMELENGVTVDLDATGSALSVRADTTPLGVRARFEWLNLVHNEGSAPFAMDGKAGSFAFYPVAYLGKPGVKMIKVDVFDDDGVVISSKKIEFSIVGNPTVQDEEVFFTESVEAYYITSFFTDAGSGNEDESLLSGEFWRKSFLVRNTTGIPNKYDPSIFTTHRSGSPTFTYTIPGFLAQEECDITLGFVENFEPSCHIGKRVFSIIVNGLLWETVDVYNAVGCNAVLTMSSSFTADSAGRFAIEFRQINSNPMVSMISVVSLGVSANKTIDPTQVSTLPSANSIYGPIEKLVLVGAMDQSVINVLQNGYVISLDHLNTTELSIRAELKIRVARVRFMWPHENVHNEGSPPYIMNGKNEGTAYNPVPYLTEPGEKFVQVTAFDSDNHGLGTVSLQFFVEY